MNVSIIYHLYTLRSGDSAKYITRNDGNIPRAQPEGNIITEGTKKYLDTEKILGFKKKEKKKKKSSMPF